MKVRPLARQLLENSQGGQFMGLQVFPGKSPQEHTLAEIVIHTSVALQCIGPGSLAEPLYSLMADPSTMKVFFHHRMFWVTHNFDRGRFECPDLIVVQEQVA